MSTENRGIDASEAMGDGAKAERASTKSIDELRRAVVDLTEEELKRHGRRAGVLGLSELKAVFAYS
jgi:hypothetical protein